MARHINIPIFIPHEGCPNDCVFCNQKTITGVDRKADRDIKTEIDIALSTYEGNANDAEIAFFGGSFTGIDRNVMIRLLDDAYTYVKNGRVKSIRLSTRPDYIDEEILEILKSRGVTHIELGIQSAKDEVLAASKRGHTFSDTEKACKLINDYGFVLGGQMMIGLPSSSKQDEIYTAKKIIELGCKETRIYPCVVFCKTELCEMAKRGVYTPLSIARAVKRSAAVYGVFKSSGVKILRIGLQSSENLSDEKEVFAGANHPALGELVIGEYNYLKLVDMLRKYSKNPDEIAGKTLIVACSAENISKVSGQHKTNKKRIWETAKNMGFSHFVIKSDDSISDDTLKMYYE